MRPFLISVLLLALFSRADAQFILEGTIKDAATLEPVIGASVYLPDLKKGTTADEEGKFSIGPLPKGKFLLEAKQLGYASLVQIIDIKSSMQIELALNSTITELNEIIISGVSHSTELKKNPIVIATLSADQLLKNNATNIIDNITQKPGVYQITTGTAISKPVIRGLGYNRIITLYDGIRQEGQQWGDEHGVELDEFSVDRIEIIKGAGSLMYGSDGIGGVINFLAPNPVQEGMIQGQWISNYQSNNGLIANSLVNNGNLKGYYWSLRATQKSAKAYQNSYDGRVFNSGFEETDVSAFAGINRSWGFTQFNVSSFNQRIGLVEGERDEDGNFLIRRNINGSVEEVTATAKELDTYHLFVPEQKINHLRIANSTNVFWGNFRMQLNVGYQKNFRREFGDVLNENDPDLFFDLQTGNYSLIFYLPETKGWNFSLGGSGMWQQNENRGREFLIPRYQLLDWGVVSFIKRNFNKLDLAAGLRVDQRKLSIHSLYLDENGTPTTAENGFEKFEEADLSFSNFSASAGITYQLFEHASAKVNVSKGFRAPNISELASNGRHEGSLRYEYGNLKLKAENSFQTDVSLLLSSPHVTAEISVFQNVIRDYIFVEKLKSVHGGDSIPDPQEPVPAYRYTQGTAQLTGGEFSIDLHPHPLDWLHFESSFSMVNAKNKSSSSDSSKYLPFTPAPRLQSEIRANARRWRNFANLFARIQYQYNARQKRALLENMTERATDAYSLWNAGVGLDIADRKQKTILTFYFTVLNVFDNAYQNHLSRLKYAATNPVTGREGVFNMGRNYSIKIILPISLKKRIPG